MPSAFARRSPPGSDARRESGPGARGQGRELDAASTYPAGEAPRWHLVGPLQSNKARRAIELFDVIETVDSLDLAERLDRHRGRGPAGQPLPVLLQVNVDDDAAKSGFDAGRPRGDLPAILDLPALVVEGLMTVGRLVDVAGAARGRRSSRCGTCRSDCATATRRLAAACRWA